MSVIFSVNGKFSAFDYCKHLNNTVKKLHLITTYPFFHVKKYGLLKSQVTSFFFIELIKRVNQKIFLDNGFFKVGNFLENLTNQLFDNLASKKIKQLNYKNLIAFSGSAKKTLLVSKKLSMKTMLIRGSSHILEVKKILLKENKKNKIKSNYPYKSLIKNEIQEYKIADKIILHSTFAINSFLKRNYAKDKILMLPLGITRNLNLKKKYKKKKIILYLGQVTARKGVHYLIKAFLKLKKKDYELHIAGPILNDIKHILSQVNSNKNIFIYGRVTENKKNELFKKASIFCLPTLEDGFAKVILEALEYKNFLLCSEYSAGPDIIKKYKNGLTINPRNLSEFTKRIKKSIKFSKKSNIKVSNLRELNSFYNWKNINRKLLSFLDI